MATTIEVWIRYKEVEGSWTLYARPKDLLSAKALVMARLQRDKIHDYEVREIPHIPPADETREFESSSPSPPPN